MIFNHAFVCLFTLSFGIMWGNAWGISHWSLIFLFISPFTSHGKMHEEFPISHLIYLFISPPFTYLGKQHKAHQYPLQGLIKLVGMSMVLEQVRSYHLCSYCLFLQFIHSSSSLMCSQLFLLLNFESPYCKKKPLISRKSFNLVPAFP